jgi:hypothetical protein
MTPFRITYSLGGQIMTRLDHATDVDHMKARFAYSSKEGAVILKIEPFTTK